MKLPDQEITEFLSEHSNWQLDENSLHRQCRFQNFAAAFGFMTQVALFAEKQDHHPDWSNSYSTVDIWLTTHQFGGISERDFIMAAAIDEIIDGKTFDNSSA